MDSTVPNVSSALRVSSVQNVSLVLRIAQSVMRVSLDQASAWFLNCRILIVNVGMENVIVMESVSASLAMARLTMGQHVLSVSKVSI